MGGYLESRQLGQERSSPYTIVGALKIQEGECGSSGLRTFKRVEDSLGDASYLIRGGVTFSEAGLVRSEETARLKPELKAGLNEPFEEFTGAAEEGDRPVRFRNVQGLAFFWDGDNLGLSPRRRDGSGLPALVEQQEEGLSGGCGKMEKQLIGDAVGSRGLSDAEAGEGGSELLRREGAAQVASGATSGTAQDRGPRFFNDGPVVFLRLL